MAILIRVGHRRITGFSQITPTGGVTPTGTTSVVNLSGNIFPPNYDPARLGGNLLAGNSWQGLAPGSDLGYTALQSFGGFYINNNPQVYPPVTDSLTLQPSPIFNQVIRAGQLRSGSHPEFQAPNPVKAYEPCVSNRFDFAAWGNQPGDVISLRVTLRLLKNGNPSFSATNLSDLGANCPGGASNTWKEWFLWQQGTNAAGVVGGTNSASRQENVLVNADRHAISSGQVGSAGGTQTQLANTTASVARITTQRNAPYLPTTPTGLGELFYGGNMAGVTTNNEWFEYIHLFIVLTSTTFITFHAARKISTNQGDVYDGTMPFSWIGHDCTCNPLYPQILKYFAFQLGGNKSSKNCRGFDQYHEWGPFECAKGDSYNMAGWVT